MALGLPRLNTNAVIGHKQPLRDQLCLLKLIPLAFRPSSWDITHEPALHLGQERLEDAQGDDLGNDGTTRALRSTPRIHFSTSA